MQMFIWIVVEAPKKTEIVKTHLDAIHFKQAPFKLGKASSGLLLIGQHHLNERERKNSPYLATTLFVSNR